MAYLPFKMRLVSRPAVMPHVSAIAIAVALTRSFAALRLTGRMPETQCCVLHGLIGSGCSSAAEPCQRKPDSCRASRSLLVWVGWPEVRPKDQDVPPMPCGHGSSVSPYHAGLSRLRIGFMGWRERAFLRLPCCVRPCPAMSQACTFWRCSCSVAHVPARAAARCSYAHRRGRTAAPRLDITYLKYLKHLQAQVGCQSLACVSRPSAGPDRRCPSVPPAHSSHTV
jgi:hypothetical protein